MVSLFLKFAPGALAVLLNALLLKSKSLVIALFGLWSLVPYAMFKVYAVGV